MTPNPEPGTPTGRPNFADLTEIDCMVSSDATAILAAMLQGQFASLVWNDIPEDGRSPDALLSELSELAAKTALLVRIHLATYIETPANTAPEGGS